VEIIADVKKNGFNRELFECAKASQLGMFCRKVSSVSGLANWVASYILHGMSINIDKLYDAISTMELSEVNEYASMHLPEPEDISWSMMHPEHPEGK